MANRDRLMKPARLLLIEGNASQMSDEGALCEKAREMIQAGQLPDRYPDRTWGGPGVGADCTICRVPVKRDEVEFEIEFTRSGDNPGLDTYQFHIRCFAAWELERHNLERPCLDGNDQSRNDSGRGCGTTSTHENPR